MLVSLVELAAWHFMPIYPDEIAFRLQMGRYTQDQGVLHGLYALCASNVKQTPLLFVLPAWILSWLELNLSPIDGRILPLITVLSALFLAIWFAVRRVNPAAAVVATTAFVGVAGSGLVLARYEYMQTLNIACCLGAFSFLEAPSQRAAFRYGFLALLLVSSLLSLYAHIQGLLFLPLTLYLAYRLVLPGLGKSRTALLMISLLGLMTQAAITFRHSTCAGYPEIEQFWANMTFNWSELESVNPVSWLFHKLGNYLRSFQYKGSYSIDYLPGIIVQNAWQRHSLTLLNFGVQIVLLANVLISLTVAVKASITVIKEYADRYRDKASDGKFRQAPEQMLGLALFLLPIIFLFLYDSVHAFYRSFFLNFLLAILLTLSLSRLPTTGRRLMANWYFALCGTVVLASLAVNMWWFTPRLHAGYEGPSISFNRDWAGINRDVAALAQDCNMDLRKGRIVVDDMTYESVKRYPMIYAVTYLDLQADVVKISMAEVIARVRPNYAVARCASLDGTKVGFSHRRGELCCLNFLEAEAHR
jgi:hypothetical protein